MTINYYTELLSKGMMTIVTKLHVNQRGRMLIYYYNPNKYGPRTWMCDLRRYNIGITTSTALYHHRCYVVEGYCVLIKNTFFYRKYQKYRVPSLWNLIGTQSLCNEI